MNRTFFLSALSTSAAVLLLSAGAPASAATTMFDRTCDPIAVDAIGNPNPLVSPWSLTFEQRRANGACTLASVFKDASLTTTAAVGEPISTLRFNGYPVDFVAVGAGTPALPRLGSNLSEEGYLFSINSNISLTLDDTNNFFDVLSFRWLVGEGGNLAATATLKSGTTRSVALVDQANGGWNTAETRLLGTPADPIVRLDFNSSEGLGTGLSTLLIDTLSFSTTAPAVGEGGGAVPEPSSIALLALAGGLAAFRRRRSDD